MYSTATALVKHYNELAKRFDARNFVGTVLIDICKVDHDFLLKKCVAYGSASGEVNWFQSYTTNHVQQVNYKWILYDEHTITVGVPQGSILSPI